MNEKNVFDDIDYENVYIYYHSCYDYEIIEIK